MLWNKDTLKTMLQALLKPIMNNRGEAGSAGGDGSEGSGGQGNEGAGESGSASTSWRDALPDNIKAHPIFEKYGSANDALSAFVDVQKLIGPEKIIMPGKDADENEWNERVFNRLGRPEKPDGYALPTDIQIPEGLPVQEGLVNRFREQAHKMGILPKQFEGLYKWYMNEQITQFNDLTNTAKQTRQDSENALRTKWGAAFDQNLALGEKVLTSFADQKTVEFIKRNGLHADPDFIQFLSSIGKVLSEDQLTGKPKQLTMSPEEAQAEIRKMEANQTDPNNPLFNAGHSEHNEAVKRRAMLYQLAYPNG